MLEPTLSLDVLLSFHKQESSEELTYLTIIYTAVLGLLGYIGSAQRIAPQVRICISVIFSIFLTSFTAVLLGSVRMHSALHTEISNYTKLHPQEFIGAEKSALFIAMSDLKPFSTSEIIIAAIALGTMVIVGLLTIGEGRVFSFWKRKRVIDENR